MALYCILCATAVSPSINRVDSLLLLCLGIIELPWGLLIRVRILLTLWRPLDFSGHLLRYTFELFSFSNIIYISKCLFLRPPANWQHLIAFSGNWRKWKNVWRFSADGIPLAITFILISSNLYTIRTFNSYMVRWLVSKLQWTVIVNRKKVNFCAGMNFKSIDCAIVDKITATDFSIFYIFDNNLFIAITMRSISKWRRFQFNYVGFNEFFVFCFWVFRLSWVLNVCVCVWRVCAVIGSS